ncbi:MAG: hypothetical protein IKY12_01100 [Clostridia bacterium]|nr:hypothetical protein [Clostridia bacterium]
MVTIVKDGKDYSIVQGEKPYAKILTVDGATDTFTPITEGVWRWHRHTDAPTDSMRMEMIFLGEPTFTLVPSVSYNGNGFGDTPEYVGDFAEDGTPWSWAWHRVTIPACTYSENNDFSVALMCDVGTNCACSLYKVEEGKKHVLIFPEEEKPKTLHRHFWEGPFEGTMEPTCDFEGIIFTSLSDGTAFRYKPLLDFAWRYYAHPMKAPMKAAELYRYSLAICHFLFEREKDGFAGFTRNAQYHLGTTSYKKYEHVYEIGWAGQSASMANAFIYEYLQSGDKEKLEMALEAHDSWIKKGRHPAGHITGRLDFDEWAYREFDPNYIPDKWELGENIYENLTNRYLNNLEGKPPKIVRDKDGRQFRGNDACNNGTAADCYFEAYEMLKGVGIEKPEYLDMAYGICNYALKTQDESGAYAKAWKNDGTVRGYKGTVGAFIILPMLKAWRDSGNEKYFASAECAFDFYYSELERDGFTTAGALDTYSIDKESSSPLLRAALALYDATGDKKYIAAAEKIAWYLSTWMMYYTIDYPADSPIGKTGFDTLGGTAVSTPHNALDMYALRDVLSFLRLYELTGYVQWRERALALWCNACQCVSDGTLVVRGALTPTGSQFEAVFHTRWGRRATGPFVPTGLYPSWPCAFRLENLRYHKDWSFFDEGLSKIEGKI